MEKKQRDRLSVERGCMQQGREGPPAPVPHARERLGTGRPLAVAHTHFTQVTDRDLVTVVQPPYTVTRGGEDGEE